MYDFSRRTDTKRYLDSVIQTMRNIRVRSVFSFDPISWSNRENRRVYDSGRAIYILFENDVCLCMSYPYIDCLQIELRHLTDTERQDYENASIKDYFNGSQDIYNGATGEIVESESIHLAYADIVDVSIRPVTDEYERWVDGDLTFFSPNEETFDQITFFMANGKSFTICGGDVIMGGLALVWSEEAECRIIPYDPAQKTRRNQEIRKELALAIINKDTITKEEVKTILSPLFGDSVSMSKICTNILYDIPAIYDDEPALPPHYDTYVENVCVAISVALENGMDPNELLPFEDGSGADQIMVGCVDTLRRSDRSPDIMRSLLEHEGDPNLRVGRYDTVFSTVDDFFWIHGEDLSENLLRCWLLLVAHGGGNDRAITPPLKPLNGHTLDELKDYGKYTFSFETVGVNLGESRRVLFVVEQATGERVAVNESPFG